MVRDDRLVAQVRELVGGDPGVDERRMFGSLIFMVDGNMACGVRDDGLLVRVGREATEAALAEPHVTRVRDGRRAPPGGLGRGRPRRAGQRRPTCATWVDRGVAYARTLPAK